MLLPVFWENNLMVRVVFYKKRNGQGDCIFFPALLKWQCWEAICLEAVHVFSHELLEQGSLLAARYLRQPTEFYVTARKCLHLLYVACGAYGIQHIMLQCDLNGLSLASSRTLHAWVCNLAELCCTSCQRWRHLLSALTQIICCPLSNCSFRLWLSTCWTSLGLYAIFPHDNVLDPP